MQISFLKKKKWNGIVVMALPKQEGKEICNWFVVISLPKQGVKKMFGIVKSGMEFGNAIATIPFHFFFFFLRNDMCTQFLQYFYNKF